MIIASLKNTARVEHLHPLFKQLFDYMRSHDLSQVTAGRLTLSGDDLYINVADATLRSETEQKLEVHRKYIDVHFPLSGDERIGWRELQTLSCESDAPFDETNDFALYAAPASVYFTLHAGELCIVYPEDAHAPIIGKGTLRKAIAKVRI